MSLVLISPFPALLWETEENSRFLEDLENPGLVKMLEDLVQFFGLCSPRYGSWPTALPHDRCCTVCGIHKWECSFVHQRFAEHMISFCPPTMTLI